MGLLDNILRRVRRKETTVNVPNYNVPQPQSPPPNYGASQQSMDSKVIDGINQRVTSIENEVSRLNVSLESVKRNISEINADLDSVKENVKMVVSLYEMVSKDFNPFMDTTPEEIKEITDALREDIKDLNKLVMSAIGDLKELYGTPDLDNLISELEEEEGTDDQ